MCKRLVAKGYSNSVSDEYGPCQQLVSYSVWVIVQGLASRKSATHLVKAMYGCGAALVVDAVIKWSTTACRPLLVASSMSAVIAMVRNTNQSSPSRLINTSSPSNTHQYDSTVFMIMNYLVEPLQQHSQQTALTILGQQYWLHWSWLDYQSPIAAYISIIGLSGSYMPCTYPVVVHVVCDQISNYAVKRYIV